MELVFNEQSKLWEMKLVPSFSEDAPSQDPDADSEPPTSASSMTMAMSTMPLFDIQDFSHVRRHSTESIPVKVVGSAGSGGGQGGAAGGATALPGGKSGRNKLIRGGSIKAFFGVSSRSSKNTPATTPKGMLSPTKKSKGSSAASLSGGGAAMATIPQFLQVTTPTSTTPAGQSSSNSSFRLPKTKLLKKTPSVKQMYNSVLHVLKTLASSRPGDTTIVPELTKRFFERVLRASDDAPNLVVTKVSVMDAKDRGRHFCSEVHTVEVLAKMKDDEDVTRTYHLVVKSQPQSEEARRFLQPSQTFEKEVQMYSQVFVDMASFVRRESVISLNCKDAEVIDVPRCFYTRWAADDNSKEDIIILENLCPQGFAFASNQEEGLDRRHSELVVREMAKFHAISYCMKLKGGATLPECNAALLERYPYLSEDSLYRQSTEDFTKRTITPVMASLAEVLRKAGHDYAAHYDWFVDLARNFHRLQMETVRVRNDFAVVCHGDLWMSNILFRYEEDQAGKPSPAEIKFIDFQSARFASLATDLVLFLFTSVQNELRRTLLGDLISCYYTTFVISVRSLGVGKDVFSLEELFIEVERHIIYGFLEGIWYLDIMYCGRVPKTSSLDRSASEDDSCQGDATSTTDRLSASNEDELEEATLRKMERRLLQQEDSRDEDDSAQDDYRHEFFELLDEVLFLLGKSGSASDSDSDADDPRRKSNRRTRRKLREVAAAEAANRRPSTGNTNGKKSP